jgi:hypothetical protein
MGILVRKKMGIDPFPDTGLRQGPAATLPMPD